MAEMTAEKAVKLLKERTPAWLGPAMFFISERESAQIAAIIQQQSATIEAMKCCGNCINWRNGNVMQCMLTYKVIGHKGKCDQWQVKEGQ